MRVGVVFPQTEIGTDPALIKDYAQTAEELGFLHILAYDHVIGANPASRPGWKPPYSHLDTFHEPLVLFGYLGGLTKKVELVTGIIILPQRQTVLVAKQAATLDVLSGGRLRLGVGMAGTRWNTKHWGKISIIGDAGRKSKSKLCANSGRRNSSLSKGAGTRSSTPESIRCRFSGRSRSGSAAATTALCAVSPSLATAGFR